MTPKPHIKHGTTPMKFTTKACLVLAGCALTSVGIAAAPAHANDWDYAIDSFDDGQQGSSPNGPIVGADSAFEIYGMALKATADTVYVAINSNLSLAGYETTRTDAADGKIGYGDLFLNFTGHATSLQMPRATATCSVSVSTETTTPAVDVGVYSGVTSKDVTAANAGFKHFNQYKKQIGQRNGIPGFGDLAWKVNDDDMVPYFGPADQDASVPYLHRLG
jgi:hypothetical protein